LVLDADSAELLEQLRQRFEQKWGAVPTTSLLVARALRMAADPIVETPPEYDRLRVALMHLRRLKADAEQALAAARPSLLPVYGEITQQLSAVPTLRENIRKQRSWSGWAEAYATCGQIMVELGQLHGRVADAMARSKR
jgi:hypothetical protein